MGSVVQFSFVPTADSRELAGDIQELFDDLAGSLPRERRALSGEWRPSLDVYETDTELEVVVDVSGVAAEAIRILFRGDVLVVVGEKAPVAPGDGQTFHLVEREFGRFARAVRLTGAFDVSRARATLRNGELTIVLPTMVERRGAGHPIRVDAVHDRSR
jgi:HSP20 family protein